jgi:hypothetical protein
MCTCAQLLKKSQNDSTRDSKTRSSTKTKINKNAAKKDEVHILPDPMSTTNNYRNGHIKELAESHIGLT